MQTKAYTDYRKYINSKQWDQFKKHHSKHTFCAVCQTPWRLVFHHEQYNLGREKMNQDVFRVCWDCHRKIHYTFFGLIKLPLWPWLLKFRRLWFTYVWNHKLIRILLLLIIGLILS